MPTKVSGHSIALAYDHLDSSFFDDVHTGRCRSWTPEAFSGLDIIPGTSIIFSWQTGTYPIPDDQ